MKLLDFFYGITKSRLSENHKVELLNILYKYNIPFRNFTILDGRIEFLTSDKNSKKISEICEKNNISVKSERTYGLGKLLSIYKKRYFLLLGIIIAILMFIWGGSVIWDIRVVGCEKKLTVTEAEEIVEKYGVFPGAHKKSLNIDKTAADIVKGSEKISWLSINIRGNTAVIELREQYDPIDIKENDNSSIGKNLVAIKDGVITGFEIIRGKPTVKRGQTVKKGDLLVSGIMDSNRIGFRIVNSQGKVSAEVNKSYKITVPFDYIKSVNINSKKTNISFLFFSKTITLFNKTSDLQNCNTDILISDLIRLPGGRVVPIGYSYMITNEYQSKCFRRTPEEARALSHFELSRQIYNDMSDDSYILRKTICEIESENSYTIECEIICVENIAEEKEIYLEP